MFSGKSEELIRRLRRAQIAKQKVLTLKHQLDNARVLNHVASHNGSKLDAQPIASVDSILELAIVNGINVVGIDEIQFFNKEIIPVICALIEIGKKVIVAGLDLDFKAMPFGCMPTLLAIADNVTKLQAICTNCGHDAHFTQRLVDGNPANHDAPIICVGAQEQYQARCRSCYTIDKMPSF